MILKYFPDYKKLQDENLELKHQNYALKNQWENLPVSLKFAWPGHYYSPIPNLEEVKKHEDHIWNNALTEIPGIDLNTNEQLELLRSFGHYYNEMPFTLERNDDVRYYANNDFYPFTDGIILYSMIRHLKPKKIIEIGSGFSSAIMIDVNEIFFEKKIQLDFIEPFPERLESLMRNNDMEQYRVHKKFIQDIDISVFKSLGENDILFIDSSHVSKVNSDVNRIIFEILPALNKGVYIHFHDLFYPFEYHKDWVYKGVAWNEAYLLRAFLQYNDHFKIAFWNTHLYQLNRNSFNHMPLCMQGPGGNFWLRKDK